MLSLVSAGLLFFSGGISSIVSIGCAIAGIVVSRKGKPRSTRGETQKHKGLAQAGFIIGIVGLVLAVLATVVWALIIVAAATDDEFRQDLEDEFDNPDSVTSLVRVAASRRAPAHRLAILAGSMADPFQKQYLMTAGPTPLPPAVSQAMAEPMLYHRAPAFIEVYARVLGRLKEVFQTENDVLTFAASGSGAMESAVANLVRPGEPALVASCGKFGERWAELCEAYGARTEHWETEWGRKVDPSELDRRLTEREGVEVVFTTFSETSTGVINDIRALTAVCHRHGALIVVDAVSGLGAVSLPQDSWGVDVVVAGSQKALMAPPGLGFASANEAALQTGVRVTGAPLLLRLGAHAQRPAQGPARQPLHSGGQHRARARRGARDDRPRRVSKTSSRAIACSVAPRARPRARSTWSCSATTTSTPTWSPRSACPTPIDGAAVPKLMRDRFGVTIAGGQGRLKGKIARVAHCGYFGAMDIVVTMAAFELTLCASSGTSSSSAWASRRPSGSSPRRACRSPSRPEAVAKVLVSESIGDSGLELLRGAGFDVELGTGWDTAELERRIGEFDGLLIRSATRLDLRAAGQGRQPQGDRPRRGGGGQRRRGGGHQTRCGGGQRAPVQRDHRGRAHAGHAAGPGPQGAPGSRVAHRRELGALSQFSGVELYEKTLGVLGFGRIGQLVAQRAISFGMRVVAFDVYTAGERFRELGVERADTAEALYAQADFITIHLPVTADTENWLNAEAFAQMKDGVRVVNVARGKLMVEEDLVAALDSGKVAGAALDVFREEPVTSNPLFGYPNVVVTPHLGASTAEATDRAGYQAAEQVVAALTGGVVTSAVNVPSIPSEDVEVLGPFLPLARDLGRIAVTLAEGTSFDGLEIECLGRIAGRDTRLLTVQVLKGALSGNIEEDVNDVNAPALAEERGIHISQTSSAQARDFTDLVRVTVVSGGSRTRVTGTALGQQHRPHLLEAWGSRFNIQLEPNLAVFRYVDQPGMIGRVGSLFGESGINISAAAVGRRPDADHVGGVATMLVTTDSPVPQEVVDRIVGGGGFTAGRTISL